MVRRFFAAVVLLAVLASARAGLGQVVAGGLDADTIRAGLRTADPNEEAYIRYVVTLVEQGRLPRAMVEATFQWARRSAPYPKKFQYFKHGLITQARTIGVDLPTGLVDLTPTIRGQVVVRVFGVEVAVPGARVTIRELDREATTDDDGLFVFRDVPFGRFTLRARGVAALLPRRETVQVTLPTTGAGNGSAFVRIVF
jgi:hypothetical protein